MKHLEFIKLLDVNSTMMNLAEALIKSMDDVDDFLAQSKSLKHTLNLLSFRRLRIQESNFNINMFVQSFLLNPVASLQQYFYCCYSNLEMQIVNLHTYTAVDAEDLFNRLTDTKNDSKNIIWHIEDIKKV